MESLQSHNYPEKMLKPLLHGCLTGQVHAFLKYYSHLLNAYLAHSLNLHPQLQKKLPGFKRDIMMLRIDMLKGLTQSTASLGLFELLTKRIRDSNDGKPLSLYQEACCGLTCGTTAALVWEPIYSSISQSNCLSYRHLFRDMYRRTRNEGVLSLWKGRGLYIGTQTATLTAMLTSYNRSLNYLTESNCLSKSYAQISASIISGFSAAACYQSYLHLNALKDFVKLNNAYKNIPFYLSHILTPGGVFKFYSGIFTLFGRSAPFYMVQWWIFEEIRSLV